MITPTDDLPLWIEVDLDMLGVQPSKPKPEKDKPRYRDHEPWTPSFDGEEPPF